MSKQRKIKHEYGSYARADLDGLSNADKLEAGFDDVILDEDREKIIDGGVTL